MPLPLKENEPAVTIVLIPHNNMERFKTRFERDLLPTILAHPCWKFQLIIIDNSDTDNTALYHFLEGHDIDKTVIWAGENLMYGPAINLAITLADHPYLVYVCSNHGRMYDPTWIDDLVDPIMQDSKVAMTGSLYPSGSPAAMGFPSNLPQVHVQGGIFAARTKALAEHPYTTDERWKHWGSDIYQCFQLMSAGFTLYHVETVNSVWRQSVKDPERWKYVHDYSEE